MAITMKRKTVREPIAERKVLSRPITPEEEQAVVRRAASGVYRSPAEEETIPQTLKRLNAEAAREAEKAAADERRVDELKARRRRRRETTLSTVTPAGIAAIDRDAIVIPVKQCACGMKFSTNVPTLNRCPECAPEEWGIESDSDRPHPTLSRRERAKEAALPQGVGAEASREAAAAEGTFLDVPPAHLAGNRFNPRQQFEQAELVKLAESLQRDGLLQPILVRAADGQKLRPLAIERKGDAFWEIVAGERRARAALIAKLPTVKVQVIVCDDARACELALTENHERKEISQVEFARGLQRLADLKGLDPASLARQRGLSESHVRNLFRLLDAPAEWQQLVVDGVVTGTHLRHAKPFLHVETIAADLKKHIDEHLCDGRFGAGEKDWRATVEDVVRQRAAPLKRTVSMHEPGNYQYGEVRIEPKQEAELDVIELPRRWGGGKERLALNRKAANALLSEKAKAWRARHTNAKKVPKEDKGKLSAAEQRQAAKEEKRARAERLGNAVDAWLCWLCSVEVRRQPVVAEEIAMAVGVGASDLFEGEYGGGNPWKKWGDPDARRKLILDFASELFWCQPRSWNPKGDRYPHISNRDEFAYWLARLSIDPEAAWRAKTDGGEQAFLGELTERWLEELDSEQARDLAEEWKLGISRELLDQMEAGELYPKLVGNKARSMPLPAELAEILAVSKGKAKTRSKPR
ncbi:MAG TPA: ParB/RepB/Spo0J family partition protein [Pirellulales bacterium]|nr:ParB/RepB/Spo0J family partition protein [Pirellulales bacterium]